MQVYVVAEPKPRKENIWSQFGISVNHVELFQQIHSGFETEVCNRVREKFNMSRAELAGVIGISPATFGRRLKKGSFNREESDSLYRLCKLFVESVALFEGDEKQAIKWLSRPAKGLGKRRPLDMLKTHAETSGVLAYIANLENGVF